MESDEDRFWEAAAHLLARHGVNAIDDDGQALPGRAGKFFAAFYRSSGDLLIRVPAGRVDQLIASGIGGAWVSGGCREKKWAAIPPEAVADWPAYLGEAYTFVAASA